jgi:cation diffusion facilitator family transporter
MADERCVRCGRRVPWYAVAGNVSLTVFKVSVGLLGGSKALVADGIHSLTDVIGTSVIIISRRVAERPADDEHPYGHGKVEFMSSAFIYILLLVISAGIFTSGLLSIIEWKLHPPNFVTVLGAAVSIGYNVYMYKLGTCAGRRNGSPALLANAFENRADAISSFAVIIGICLAMFAHPVCDPVAAMMVGIIIFVNCVVELGKAAAGLMDKSLPGDTLARIRSLVVQQRGVKAVTFIKSRSTGNKYWLDIGVQVKRSLPVSRADTIADEIRSALMRRSSHIHSVEVFIAPD